MRLYDWNELEEHFQDTVILGNGASISVDNRFAYSSLLEKARQTGYITDSISQVFEHFETSDFELVLEMLWHASHINEALQVRDQKTHQAYQEVRAALINAVRQVHPEYEDVNDCVLKIGQFLKNFKTVFALNYDLLTYWSMLRFNGDMGGIWFKDCLIDGVLDPNWTRLREPYRADGATLVFYPHGHLAWASSLSGQEIKINASRMNSLLNCIFDAWQTAKFSPVFVSEGDTSQKVNSISRSQYLSTVFRQVFPEKKQSLVIYGWSLGDQDTHILKQLESARIPLCAVSVHSGVPNKERYCDDIKAKLKRYLNNNLKVYFFDASSPGAWINA
ncbi:DUF4917 family protein [uncultured Salinisphaera sp.]|uniref:DUF4917 family protein n=1 Tax=uncultured Salinisphaera sp. TaxID=359372 RepID=UPI0032B2E490|tara:strand:+ start:281 stop:1279 length:999 start_codon:yes stop_codon:yes gene_type:complete